MSLEKTKFIDWTLSQLKVDAEIDSFESEDEELNDFLINDAKNYQFSLLTVTYLIQTKDDIIAYFSLSND
jgi:hypothetical protein